jgi:hypothetical protein
MQRNETFRAQLLMEYMLFPLNEGKPKIYCILKGLLGVNKDTYLFVHTVNLSEWPP